MNPIKKLGLVPILNLIKAGHNPTQISKRLNVPKQSISYYIRELKRLGCIGKAGYGTWKFIKEVPKEVSIRPKGTHVGQSSYLSKQKSVRGHAFIWKIEFYDPIDWHKIIKQYKKSTLTFHKIGKGKGFYRTIHKNRKIWLTNDGLIIYEPLDFFGPSSLTVKGEAVFEMDLLVRDLLRKLGIGFRDYRFTTSREHYALIKNALAKQYNDRKEKLYISNDEGTVWQWIDHSKGEHERETNEPIVNRQIQNYENSHKKFGYKHDANFINDLDGKVNSHDKTIEKSMTVLEGYAKQISLHLTVEKKQLLNLEKQSSQMDEQNKLFKLILEKLENTKY